MTFETIIPKNNNWLNLTDNDFDDLMPLMSKEVKAKKGGNAIFKIFSRGVASQRDEWVYDFSENNLAEKMKFFAGIYNKTLANPDLQEKLTIKWDRELDKYRVRGIIKKFEQSKIVAALYRPFLSKPLYFDEHFNGMTYQWFDLYSNHQKNMYMAINSAGNTKGFHSLASGRIIDLHCTGDSQCLSLHYFDANGEPVENITDWALKQFQGHYKDKKITKDAIFNYVYGVLHHPAYRKKYEQNLKREFPRIPLYEDFKQWRNWGKDLMELHIGFEKVRPFKLKRIEAEKNTAKRSLTVPPTEAAYDPKVKLKADKENGVIEIDEITSLSGVPVEVWEYKLGNRSAVEWVLEEYKESKPKDPTIREQFNTYRFCDYKEQVIDLLGRVVMVSVETMKIIRQMP